MGGGAQLVGGNQGAGAVARLSAAQGSGGRRQERQEGQRKGRKEEEVEEVSRHLVGVTLDRYGGLCRVPTTCTHPCPLRVITGMLSCACTFLGVLSAVTCIIKYG